MEDYIGCINDLQTAAILDPAGASIAMLTRLESYILNLSRMIIMQVPGEPRYRNMYTPSTQFPGVLCGDLVDGINERVIITLVIKSEATDSFNVHRLVLVSYG